MPILFLSVNVTKYKVLKLFDCTNAIGTHGMMKLEGMNGTKVDIFLYLDPDLGYRLPVPRYALDATKSL
jgi:hypothetical protein